MSEPIKEVADLRPDTKKRRDRERRKANAALVIRRAISIVLVARDGSEQIRPETTGASKDMA